MTPQQYCRDKAAKSGSSFYYSFLFLPVKKREAIMALYAFCREVDDAVDEISDPLVAAQTLAWWRQEISRTFAGQATHPVGKALAETLHDFDLHEEYFHEIIDGMEMDLTQHRYPAYKNLALYCHRVASVVGLLSAQIFGFSDRKTLKFAEKLGLAFQLTNIIRDVREDAERGRIYLPLDEMQQFGVTEQSVLALKQTEALTELLKFQTQRAEQFYQEAMQLLPEQDRHNQCTALIMAEIYRTTLHEIAHDNFPVMKQRISLTPIRKLWLAWRTLRREKKRIKSHR
ncbi:MULTISPECIES: presqualene diphosphate synthase HpnD [unclassified Methylophaga]|jgi:phytoene synthase|uniref:presqualene diphosphate synthase HpnD n=3 Tax=Methylophaga TaxID=40222 RepID=UPI000C988093|nr:MULTISPECIES: presqualene diphosphate synthase HpnD [unclassified Methylophaga]MAK66272.1 squalene synthase HpnD [Methylophaga sp.]MAY17468.1 squalene synthase HpnD [Methylophaga sp.]MBN47410.1 squalene synthase HpnD [Methylophaga sp.]HAO24328.1 squalene synthase HpnD [Methylophaga sp.]HCD04648.1 squalene synthase HpnD [Methylophaga sp.]|tara:strand:+ start:2107 stop:2964 length:858 start_codon:yes stop_codon:yes gene_type:complete